MDPEVYTRLSLMEEQHWWFRARRRILRSILERHLPTRRPLSILEAGCGTGGNLAMLASFGDVSAFELDAHARETAAAKGFRVEDGRLPDAHPFVDTRFDLIVLFDVLEHVEHDQESLVALRNLLNPGGCLMLTVPAFPFLWSAHDETHQHFRRYRRPGLRQQLQSAGYVVERLTYYNSWLFPAIAAARVLKKATRSDHSDEETIPSPQVNRLFEGLFASERFLLPYMSFPFGVSLMALARPLSESNSAS
jgi:SAM-dependent methyltransferase